jgi:hypothetical protein
VHTLSSLMRTRENFPIGHPSQIAPSQARLTWRFFRDRLLKQKMHLVGMGTLLILLSFGPGHHHPRGQDITSASLSPPLHWRFPSLSLSLSLSLALSLSLSLSLLAFLSLLSASLLSRLWSRHRAAAETSRRQPLPLALGVE